MTFLFLCDLPPRPSHLTKSVASKSCPTPLINDNDQGNVQEGCPIER
uniref:Uncharacterized protein n=1 Tax=Arundo donax TaxID=35708 RepID=A0A0A9FHN2_ARUDO